MLNNIKHMLAKFSAPDRGLERLECPRGVTGFRGRLGDLSFMACELCQNSIWIVGLCRW